MSNTSMERSHPLSTTQTRDQSRRSAVKSKGEPTKKHGIASTQMTPTSQHIAEESLNKVGASSVDSLVQLMGHESIVQTLNSNEALGPNVLQAN